MLYVTRSIQIPEEDLQESFIRSSGPGGQNVNKVATAVQLRFDAGKSSVLDEEVKVSLKRLAGRRMTDDGVIVIEAKRYREQEKNRADARERLVALIRRATEKPRARRQTRPTRASVQRRVEGKKKRGNVKQMRNKPEVDE
ncbi:MAG: aminoacyl-tRNA hydrolase [Anaerolineaceae bacterium]|nr:aminoacyl-tRNA hydrolase [Anaerolineaceae bacterium]